MGESEPTEAQPKFGAGDVVSSPSNSVYSIVDTVENNYQMVAVMKKNLNSQIFLANW